MADGWSLLCFQCGSIYEHAFAQFIEEYGHLYASLIPTLVYIVSLPISRRFSNVPIEAYSPDLKYDAFNAQDHYVDDHEKRNHKTCMTEIEGQVRAMDLEREYGLRHHRKSFHRTLRDHDEGRQDQDLVRQRTQTDLSDRPRRRYAHLQIRFQICLKSFSTLLLRISWCSRSD